MQGDQGARLREGRGRVMSGLVIAESLMREFDEAFENDRYEQAQALAQAAHVYVQLEIAQQLRKLNTQLHDVYDPDNQALRSLPLR